MVAARSTFAVRAPVTGGPAGSTVPRLRRRAPAGRAVGPGSKARSWSEEQGPGGPKGRSMNRRFGAALAVAALIVAGSMPATVAAAKPSGRTFTHLDVSRIDPQITPAILS